jgi:Type IV secretion system pilin
VINYDLDTMKKQIVIALSIISLASTVLLLPYSVYAASAKCYIGAGWTKTLQSTCPAPSSVGGSSTTYSDSGPKDTSPATCYDSQGPTGTADRTRVTFTPGNCRDLQALADATRGSRCRSSGGEWVTVPASSTNGFTAGFACRCPEPLVGAGDGVCAEPGGSDPGASDPGGESIPEATGPVSDCKVDAGAEVSAGNCQIIGLLNTAFSLVSGAITLAVIGNIIYAGIQYSMAQGDPSAASKAKNRIRGAVIAFFMYMAVYAFIQWLIPGGVF